MFSVLSGLLAAWSGKQGFRRMRPKFQPIHLPVSRRSKHSRRSACCGHQCWQAQQGALARSLLILVEHEEITEEEFAGFFCEALQGKFFRFE